MSIQDCLQPKIGTDVAAKEKKGFFARLTSGFLVLMVVLMGLGNWADSKQLLTEGYQAFVTHFTHQIESNRMASLDIGNYLQYAENHVGMPQVIKASGLDPEIEYRYYKDPKYLLTLINKNQRILGIVLHSLDHKNPLLTEFSPAVPFSDMQLKLSSIADITTDSNLFFYDNQNITYYLQSRQLGPEGMFLNQLAGFTEYQQSHADVYAQLTQLDNAILDDDTGKITSLTQKLATHSASFYAISELPPEYIADSLLTKCEFNAYF